MSLADFLGMLRRRWLVILLCVVVAAGVVFAITPAERDTTPRIGSYTATATLIVGPRSADPNQVTNTASLGRIALFITTGEVPLRAAEKLGYEGDPAVLADSLNVDTSPESASLTITTTASDGERAASVANTFADEAIAFFETNPPGAGNTQLTMLQRATPIPNESTAAFVIPPDRNIRTALAGVLGLLFGIGLALLLERMDSRLRTREEIAKALDMPIVGDVPKIGGGQRRNKTLLTVAQPLSPYADGYRSVRTALVHSKAVTADAAASESLVVLVTSARMAEGKSTSSANLAASFAETGQDVIVIDADFRSPDVHEKLDVPQGAGVSDLIDDSRDHSVQSLLRPTSVPGVKVLTAGNKLAQPASLVSHLGPVITEARRLADVVIVDSAPMLEAAEVFDILPHVDDVVLVVRSRVVTESAARRVSELLGRFNVPVVGAVIIGAPSRKGDGYGTGYGYGYGEAKRGGSRAARLSLVERDAVEDSLPQRSK